MKKITKENLVFRFAMLNGIEDILRKNKTKCLSFEESTYADTKDMVHFTCDGHKCILLSVEKPNVEKGTMTMTLLAKGKELKDWTDIRLNFDCYKLRCNLLERILNEVYDWLKDADDEDWDTYRKDLVAGYYDTYLNNQFGMNTIGK